MNDCQIMSLNQLDKYLEDQAYQNKIPLHGTFELTARCNFNCKMCYVHLNEQQIKSMGTELTNEQWLEIARQAKDAGMLYLTLTGGEIFARPGFRELYEKLSQMGFLIQLYSNGYLIDEDVISWLGEMPPHILRFTLYGASNETYSHVCGVKDGFDRVSRAIDLVKQAKIPFYMVSTLVKENIHDHQAMQDFADEKNVIITFSHAVFKAVRGATQDAAAHRVNNLTGLEEVLQYMVSNSYNHIYSYPDHMFDICKKYRRGFWLTWNGNIQLCGFMSEPSIPLTENIMFNEAWNQLLERLDSLQEPEECRSCKYKGFCKKCPGVLAAECGSCSAVSEDFCAKAKYIYHEYRLMKDGAHK